MSSRRAKRRANTPCGLFLLDKPKGPSTRDLLRILARRLDIHSAGHCGTLDPLASGLVVVVSGAATRVQDLFTGHDKYYEASLRFGARSATDDAEGPITLTEPAPEAVEAVAVEAALDALRGEIDQVPPAFSAIHIDGQRLYRLAREGKLPEDIPARRVRVDHLEMGDYAWPSLKLDVACGAGTYIRSLARDLGEALGVGAHLTDLRRTRSGPFRIADARDPEEISLDDMIPLEVALQGKPRVALRGDELERLLQGKEFASPKDQIVVEDDLITVDGRIVGRARPLEEGRRFRLKRIIVDPRKTGDAPDAPQSSKT